MTTITVEQAEMRISELFAAVLRGEEIVIETDGDRNIRISQEMKLTYRADDFDEFGEELQEIFTDYEATERLDEPIRYFGHDKDKITYIADNFDDFDEELQEMFAEYIP